MPHYCCVAGCPNKSDVKLENQIKTHFYSILCGEKEKRKLWLQAIPLNDRLKNYSSEKELLHVKICGRHFISGKKQGIDYIDYVPSLFNFTSEDERQEVIQRQKLKLEKEGDSLKEEKQAIKISTFKNLKNVKCKHCSRYFTNEHLLTEHEEHAHKPRPCKHCSKIFYHQGYFMRHQKVHSDDKPYVCETCGSRRKSLDSLRWHRQTKHAGEAGKKREIKKVARQRKNCKECGKWFSDGSKLIRHKLLHMRQKSYVCDHCGKQFARCDYLRAHIRKHTGEKQFPCMLCGQAFTDKRYLNNHLRKEHNILSQDVKKENATFLMEDIKQEK